MINPNEDYYGWTQETIEKLRQGRLSEVSADDLIRELEEMASSDRNEVENRLIVLLAHLLKWKYQPERRGRSWNLTLKEQRRRIARRLRKSPSLKPTLEEIFDEAYLDAVTMAARETDKDEDVFPPTFAETGWSWEQVLDTEFYPD